MNEVPAGSAANLEDRTSRIELLLEARQLRQEFSCAQYLEAGCAIRDDFGEDFTTALKRHRCPGPKGFETITMVFGRELGAEAHVTTEISRVAGLASV